jgi:hypothetical protein
VLLQDLLSVLPNAAISTSPVQVNNQDRSCKYSIHCHTVVALLTLVPPESKKPTVLNTKRRPGLVVNVTKR